jgi:hypothetical protein
MTACAEKLIAQSRGMIDDEREMQIVRRRMMVFIFGDLMAVIKLYRMII